MSYSFRPDPVRKAVSVMANAVLQYLATMQTHKLPTCVAYHFRLARRTTLLLVKPVKVRILFAR